MDYERIAGPDGVDIRVPREHAYRVCGVCGNDCAPDSAGADGLGMRIVFVCPDHGVQSIVDPFEDQR